MLRRSEFPWCLSRKLSGRLGRNDNIQFFFQAWQDCVVGKRPQFRRPFFQVDEVRTAPQPQIRIIGAQPSEGSRIPGIRKWPQEYLPKIYDPSTVDELVLVSQSDAEEMCRQLAREEGIFAGISAAGACWVAQQIAAQVKDATIVFIVCDRGDRYLSTGVFPA